MSDQNTKRRADEVKQERRRRQDTGPLAGLKLSVPSELMEEGFEHRWINGDELRIHNKTVMDDWDIVKTKAIAGEGEGTPVSRMVGKGDGGQPLKAYLCRKPSKFYKADKAKELAAVQAREESIRRGEPQSGEGLGGPTTYIPDRADGFSTGPGKNQIGTTYKP